MPRQRPYIAKPEPTLSDGEHAGLIFWTAVAAVITFFVFAVCGSGYGHASSRALAEQAFTATPPFHSPQQAARHIMQVDRGVKAAALPRAQAYAYLKHHSGQNRVFVTSGSSNGRLDILARAHNRRDAIVEIKGPANGDVQSEKAIWSGSFNWGGYLETEGVEGGLVLLLVLAAGLNDVERYRRRKLEAAFRERAQLEQWRKYVPPDGLYGPLEPEHGFEVLVPAWDEEDGQAVFSAKRYRWDYSGWREQDEPWEMRQDAEERHRRALAARPRLKDVIFGETYLSDVRDWQPPAPLPAFPPALRPVEIRTGAGPDVLASKWFDFCKGLADLNAQGWAERQQEERAAEERRLEAEAERERVREQARLEQLERVSLEQLLQPGHELMRGLGQPEA